MPFSDVIGHSKQVQALRTSLKNKRLHHAYLFLGPEGVGKRTVALSLAKAILCREMEGDFCDECADCVRVQNRNHPDVQVVERLPKKNEISIQQVRELERELSYRSFTGRRKIAVVDSASAMNYPAQNALLKTLEEPPRDSLLILLSTSAGALPTTMVSRCVRLCFAPVPVEEVASFLADRKGVPPQQAQLLATVSLGSPGRAISAEIEDVIEKRTAWADKISSLAPGNAPRWMALAEEIASDREASLQFLEWAKQWYRDLLIYQVTGSLQHVSNPDLEDNIRRQARKNSQQQVLSLLFQADAAAAGIRRNINRRMVLEEFLMKASAVGSRL